MLNCKQVTELASDYLDNELPATKRLAVWLHIARCSHCRRFASELKAGDEVMRHHFRTDAEPAYFAKLQSQASRLLLEEKTRALAPQTDTEASNEPLIQGIDEPEDERVRRIFAEVRDKEGFVPNLFKAYAHQPEVLEYNWAREKSLLYCGVLAQNFKSAIVVVVSTDNCCHYCIHHHRAALEQAGLSSQEVDWLITDPERTRFNDREKALLALVRQANRDPHQPADALLARVRSAGATDAEIVEAMSVMELYSSWNKFLDVMRIPLESDAS